MRNNHTHSRFPHLRENLFRIWEDHHVGELDQHPPQPIHRILPRIGQSILNVVVHQVKITTGVNANSIAQQPLQLRSPRGDQRRLKQVMGVSVRRRHNVRRPASGRHCQHGDAHLQGTRAIIHSPEDMGVNVNHRFSSRFFVTSTIIIPKLVMRGIEYVLCNAEHFSP
ncbi:MAG: hypothetical protein JW394_0951 [Nitrospira sp.]|nr:hypothetical protein [Nitrospira sp.]